MRGVKIHAVLLALAVAAALGTANKERYVPESAAWTPVWDRDTTEVVSITYESERGQVAIRPVGDGAARLLWGSEVLREVESGPAAREFPVGLIGLELLRGLADFRVPRVLGDITSEQAQDFGFETPAGSLTVEFVDQRLQFEVGRAVHGGDDVYAREVGSGRVYVLPEEVIRPMQIGSGALYRRQLHDFRAEDVARVRLLANASVREMVRDPDAPGAGWMSTEGGDAADAVFANFMERVGQLAIAGFDRVPQAESLEQVLRVEYASRDGEALGFLELLRGVDDGVLYLRSDRTRIPAQSIEALSQRVVQGLPDIF